MGKYSENPIDNIQGYLGNIEMMLERIEKQQKEQAAALSSSSDSSELDELKEEFSSIRTAIGEIRKDNGLISASMHTVAEAIGTVPTEEERKKQHQEDLQYIVNNTKQKVTVALPQDAMTQLNDITGGIKKFDDTLKNAGNIIGAAAKNAAESAAKNTTGNITSSVVENWFWRVVCFVALIAYCLAWLFPKVQEIDFPNGMLGFALTVLIIICVCFAIMGVYKWGQMNGNGYY